MAKLYKLVTAMYFVKIVQIKILKKNYRRGLIGKKNSESSDVRWQMNANELVYALLGIYERRTIELQRTINEAARMPVVIKPQ